MLQIIGLFFLCAAIVVFQVSVLSLGSIGAMIIIFTAFYYSTMRALGLALGLGILEWLMGSSMGVSVVSYGMIVLGVFLASKVLLANKSLLALELLGFAGTLFLALVQYASLTLAIWHSQAPGSFPILDGSLLFTLLLGVVVNAGILAFLYGALYYPSHRVRVFVLNI